MQELTVIGVEDDSVLAAAQDGTRFRLVIDDAVRSRLRQPVTAPRPARRLSPREVQTHIRSGLSATEVAELTGESLEFIARFEGPVLAEREYVVQSALAVPVHTAEDAEPLGDGRTFGTVMDERLSAIGATDTRWASWKESGAWIIKLSFSARSIEHDARWQFEPRKATLIPLNNDATSLSRQGEAPAQLIPRLRAVSNEIDPEPSRFDSGAFIPLPADFAPVIQEPAQPAPDAAPFVADVSPVALPRLGERREPRAPAATGQTADLLEALRRRRGERESAVFQPEPGDDTTVAPQGVRLVDIPLDDFTTDPTESPTGRGRTTTQPLPVTQAPSRPQRRGGRATMPSWDEIVFGARPDDDPA